MPAPDQLSINTLRRRPTEIVPDDQSPHSPISEGMSSSVEIPGKPVTGFRRTDTNELEKGVPDAPSSPRHRGAPRLDTVPEQAPEGAPQTSGAPAAPATNAEPNLFHRYVIEPMKSRLPNWTPFHTEVAVAAVSVMSSSLISVGGALKAMPDGPQRIVDAGMALKQAGITLEFASSALEVINQLAVAEKSNPWATLSGGFGVVGSPLVALGEEGPRYLDDKLKWGILIGGNISINLARLTKVGALIVAHRSEPDAQRMQAIKDIAGLAPSTSATAAHNPAAAVASARSLVPAATTPARSPVRRTTPSTTQPPTRSSTPLSK